MVILLVGPAGCGKSGLAQRMAEHQDWIHLCEDEIWNEIGHPPHEPRTDTGQRLVHARVHERIRSAVDARLNVVFEFLVYENPPLRITDYQDALASSGIRFVTKVLRPSVEAILERQRVRGRPIDRDFELRRRRPSSRSRACTPI